jgi:hypothetical protein
MTKMTALQIAQLNNMNAAAQRAGLGTRLDALEYDSLVLTTGVALAKTFTYTTTPALQTATYVLAATPLTAAAAGQDITAGITQPDVPRIVTVKGNAGGIAGNVVITGTDAGGTACIDTIALSGAGEVLGVKAFKTVTNIHLPQETHAGTDTVSVGVGVKLGLPVAITAAGQVIASTFDGSADVGTTTTSGTLPTSLYAVAGTMNAVKRVVLTFVV